VGLIAAVLLVVTEFSTVAKVDVASGSCHVLEDTNPDLADRCELSGFERNGGSFLLLALLTGAMAWGAGLGGSRPAGVALIGVGAVVLIWALFVDLPVTKDTGLIGQDFAGATASAGAGLVTEIVAGALAVAAGVIRLLAREYRPERTDRTGRGGRTERGGRAEPGDRTERGERTEPERTEPERTERPDRGEGRTGRRPATDR
jgi:hypothetical protein